MNYTALSLAAALGLPPPTRQQAAIISAPLEPMVVVAGAGSGKTETMATKVIWLVANGIVRADEVLGLTFTRKAASELASRVRGRLGQLRFRGLLPHEDVGEPTISTYHAYASRIVAEHGLRSGFEPSARFLSEAGTWQLADAVVQAYDGDMSHVDFAPSTVTAAVLDIAGQLAENLLGPDQLLEWTERFMTRVEALPRAPGQRTRGAYHAPVAAMLQTQRARAQLVPLVHAYLERKRSAEAMDFGDQMAKAAIVARDHGEVGESERSRSRVVVLDEYQDTSHAQLVLLSTLFGDGHPVTAVGDPCQSIYGWRGASAGNLVRFPHDFPRQDRTPASVVALSVSWRNQPAILDLANAVSTPLRVTGGVVAVPELETRPDEHRVGQVRCALLTTVDDEAAWVAQRLAEEWRHHDTPPTTAVLVRRRSQCDVIAAALRLAGLPVDVVGVGGLLDTAEVQDLVAMLRVLSDPTAGDAMLRILTGARWRLGPRDVAALGSRAAALARAAAPPSAPGREAVQVERSIIEALDDLGPADSYSAVGYSRLCTVRDQLRALRARSAQPLPDFVADVERTLGIDIAVACRDWENQLLARGHLDAFAEVVADFHDSAEQSTLSAFLAYLRAAAARERGLTPGQVTIREGAVQILTVHAAKGLEWDVVAVPGLSRGIFPASGGSADVWTSALGTLPFALRGDARDLPEFDLSGAENQADVEETRQRFLEAWNERGQEEERRLAYVALTRARGSLYCSGYWWDQATRPRGPSIFLDEIRERAAQGIDPWVDPPDEGAANPLSEQTRRASWPFDPLGERRHDVELAAGLVREMAKTALTPDEEAQQKEWAAEAELLLAERAAMRRRDVVEVGLPNQMSVSQLLMLERDPAELARTIRRPLPFPPAPLARRGTAFHTWLEGRFGAQRLFEVDDLPGAGDADAAPDDEFAALQEVFLRSEWADRIPNAVEIPFTAIVAGVVVRGRMDAVFRDGDVWTIVDWKTGSPPAGKAAETAALQLATYRLAWADLAKVPVTQVRAAFHYVSQGVTVRPVDLLDAEQLAMLVTSVPLGSDLT